MKNKLLLVFSFLFFTFCFIVLFKGLNNPNIYKPNLITNKTFEKFNSKELFSGIEISSEEIFIDSKFYILNIWASWCVPCRDEHKELMQLSKNLSVKMIGLNYKDNFNNAKKFIQEFGNPYSIIITDKNGFISIELGAYGVPETYIMNKDKIIVKKIIGPLNQKLLEEINLIIK